MYLRITKNKGNFISIIILLPLGQAELESSYVVTYNIELCEKLIYILLLSWFVFVNLLNNNNKCVTSQTTSLGKLFRRNILYLKENYLTRKKKVFYILCA